MSRLPSRAQRVVGTQFKRLEEASEGLVTFAGLSGEPRETAATLRPGELRIEQESATLLLGAAAGGDGAPLPLVFLLPGVLVAL